MKKDGVSKHYFEDKSRFADLLNAVVFDGRQVLQADNIHERKREVRFSKEKEEKYISVTRDVANEVDFHASVVLVALEEQSDIHYAMPVRVMAGDCAYYHEQWKKAAKQHREKVDVLGAEFVSGFAKKERLVPSITIVLYFGEKPWDGPRCLRDMFDLESLPEEVQKYIADYPMFLMEVRTVEDLERFRTDLKYVFGYLQNVLDKNSMKKYISENQDVFEHMSDDAYDFMSSMSHTKELKVLKEKCLNPKGGVDMCKAIRDMIEEGRQEGKLEGKQEGFLLAVMCMKMRETGKTDEEIAVECDCSIEDIRMLFSAIN